MSYEEVERRQAGAGDGGRDREGREFVEERRTGRRGDG
jgi:hypothetical protein